MPQRNRHSKNKERRKLRSGNSGKHHTVIQNGKFVAVSVAVVQDRRAAACRCAERLARSQRRRFRGADCAFDAWSRRGDSRAALKSGGTLELPMMDRAAGSRRLVARHTYRSTSVAKRAPAHTCLTTALLLAARLAARRSLLDTATNHRRAHHTTAVYIGIRA